MAHTKKEKKLLDMTSGEPFKLLVLYSFPILLGSIFQQLYSMCDTIIVGKYLGPNALAAVGNTGPMNFLVFGLLYGMTSGFSVITAQMFGAKNEERLKESVAMNILLNSICAVAVTLIACALTSPLLKVTNTPQEIFSDSFSYIFIIYLGIIFVVLYNACTCVLRAVGDSKTPLYFLIISSALNIILDIVFIAAFRLGVKGAALATIISQGVSGILSLAWIIIRYPILHVNMKHFAAEKHFVRKHLANGMNMGFQFSITAVGVVILQGALNKFGSTKIAAFTAAQKVEQLVTVAAGVMGVCMANFAGQNLGAGKIDRIKEGVIKTVILSTSFALLGTLLTWTLGDQMTSLFLDRTNTEPSVYSEILGASRIYLRTCSSFFPVLFVIFVFRNALQGIGRGFWPLMGGVFELFARSIAAYTLPGFTGFSGICIAQPIAWFSAAIPLAVAYFTIIRQMENKVKGLSAQEH